MQILYLFFAVITSGYSGVCYRKLSLSSGNRAASFLIPVLWYAPLTLVFGIWALFSGFDCSIHVLLPALLASIAYIACAFSLLESMKANSFALTIIITNLSFIFPVVLSMLFLNESAGLFQVIGMLLAVVVIVVLNIGKKEEGKSTLPALLLAVLSSLGNGVIDFAIKIQEHYTSGASNTSFFFFSYLFATIGCLLVYMTFHLRGKKAVIVKEQKKSLLSHSLALAVCNGVCFFVVGLLAGMMNAAAQFTVITSLSIVVSLLIGNLQIRKRFTRRERISLLICAIAIACQYFNLV